MGRLVPTGGFWLDLLLPSLEAFARSIGEARGSFEVTPGLFDADRVFSRGIFEGFFLARLSSDLTRMGSGLTCLGSGLTWLGSGLTRGEPTELS